MSTDPSPPSHSRRQLRVEDYRALGAFRHALRKFLAFSEAGAERLGLTPQQHQALLAIRAHDSAEGMSIGELAESLLIRNHSAVGLVARLVERGLVVRDTSAKDRRRIILTLTKEGSAKLETISRNNLGKLKGAAPAFHDLFDALRRLDADPE